MMLNRFLLSIAVLLVMLYGLYSYSSIAEPLRLAKISGIEVKLTEGNGKCLIEGDNISVGLEIPWPCGFHNESSGAPRVVDVSGAVIALVEYSKPSDSNSKDCVTMLQAVKVVDSKVTASEFTDSVAACLPFRWDEKVFTGLFAD